ncbi:hypothetical protein E3P99_02826 [Wallemia hederae]|uniref:FAS1 domain-containing protein n=1 Tax=Wallemia hederae TaxID=1540922 RepID=A0A4T0FIQ6_9BASI|nr:hypothetical protein E3P99_02826 [Wallemia hederae]
MWLHGLAKHGLVIIAALQTSLASLAPSPPPAMPTSTFANGLVQALTNLNASTMASLVREVPDIFDTKLGGHESKTGGKSMTLLVPLNDAFYGSGISRLSHHDLQDLLNYHILDVWIPSRDGRYISPTLLTKYTNLPPSHPTQSLIVDVVGDNTSIVTPIARLPVVGKSTYMNVHIWTIPQFIHIPECFFDTLAAMHMTDIANFVASAFLKHVVRSMSGVTAFVPTPQAFCEGAYTYAGFEDDHRDIALRHFLTNKTVIYSSDLVDGMALETLYGTSVAIVQGLDGKMKVVAHDGYTTANIIRSDVLLSNGVIHVGNVAMVV